MQRFRAAWVLPIAEPPIRNGWVAVENGRVVAVGQEDLPATDLGRVVLMPGLVNAHTHLELSYLRGRIPPASAFVEWVRTLLRERREGPTVDAAHVAGAAARAVAEARASGTAVFGDVANGLGTVEVLREAGVAARVFLELIGFAAGHAHARVQEARLAADGAQGADATVRVSLAAHAPYSVSPALFEALRQDLDAQPDGVSCVHVAESPEETEFLRKGRGPCRQLLEDLGAWNPEWHEPGTSTVAYLDSLGFLDRRVLAVHGVQCDGEDLSRLQALGVTLVSCPRSNAYVGVGAPPLEAFYAMDVDVAFGTDSLTSAPTLSMFDELAEARRIAPRVPAAALLESATRVGARALGFEADYGTLEVGRRAPLLAVRVPEGVVDVEEYLVSGVDPGQVSWVGEGS